MDRQATQRQWNDSLEGLLKCHQQYCAGSSYGESMKMGFRKNNESLRSGDAGPQNRKRLITPDYGASQSEYHEQYKWG